MTYYNFTIKGQINTEDIIDAIDILEMQVCDLEGVRNVIINIDIKDESVTSKKIEQQERREIIQDIKPKKPTQEQMTGGY